MGIFLFICILLVLILVHEWGHFLSAKFFGITVHEFGIGFPPRIGGIQKGETLYSINALPFGGFVKIAGEDGEEVEVPRERKMTGKPLWVQAIVIVAGVFANLILAWVLFSGGLMAGISGSVSSFPEEYVHNARVLITGVLPGSPAETSGLKAGDEIVSLKGLSGISPEHIQSFIGFSGGSSVSFLYKRGGEEKEVIVTPREGVIADRYAVGISMDTVGNVKLPPLQAIIAGAKVTLSSFVSVAQGFFGLLKDAFSGHANLSSVTGPVGIASMVGDAEELGALYLVSFMAFLSINLAFVNLIPFPALDGGRLLFLLIEGVLRKPLPSKISSIINATGFVVLILLMLLVTYQDILRLVH